MKKTLLIFVSLVLMFTLVACGKKSVDESTSESTDTTKPNKNIIEANDDSSDEPKQQEAKTYNIGEAGEANGLSITVDKVVSPDPNIFLYGPDEGFVYMQVYFTLMNISKETIETPKRQAIYIVYEEGPTGDECDMTSDNSSDVLPGNKDGLYEAFTELAPGESTSGWMVYPRPSNKSDVIIHYYSKFINVSPDLKFAFSVE